MLAGKERERQNGPSTCVIFEMPSYAGADPLRVDQCGREYLSPRLQNHGLLLLIFALSDRLDGRLSIGPAVHDHSMVDKSHCFVAS